MGKPRYDIGMLAGHRKELREQAIEKHQDIIKAKQELEQLQLQLESLKKEVYKYRNTANSTTNTTCTNIMDQDVIHN